MGPRTELSCHTGMGLFKLFTGIVEVNNIISLHSGPLEIESIDPKPGLVVSASEFANALKPRL